jgi:hypothetical protein
VYDLPVIFICLILRGENSGYATIIISSLICALLYDMIGTVGTVRYGTVRYGTV